ncbi:MAG: FprA family A-type flavoprotein [Chloroflexota bacterium]
MGPREIRRAIHWVGAVDWDRRLFDELIPLPDGTSYNAYLVRGSQKTVLIDTVDPTMTELLVANLDSLGIKTLDYVVANHAEQDHSGTLPEILARYPMAKLLCTPKCQPMLVDLLAVSPERIMAVEDRAKVSLGDRTLEFIHAPWVHWPETMLSYLPEEKILFPGDLFGSHLATSDLYVTDEGQVYEAAKRYYAEIMMPFRANIEKHLERLQGYPIELIAPSHGPLYPRPAFILDAYHSWVLDPLENTVVLAYVSMHGSTRLMVRHLAAALVARGVSVKQFDLASVDIGKLAVALVDAATLVLGTPAVLAGAHPKAIYAAFLANALRPKTRFATIIGSFGWGSRLKEQVIGMLPNLKVEMLEPVLAKGLPGEVDFQALDNLAAAIAARHKEL